MKVKFELLFTLFLSILILQLFQLFIGHKWQFQNVLREYILLNDVTTELNLGKLVHNLKNTLLYSMNFQQLANQLVHCGLWRLDSGNQFFRGRQVDLKLTIEFLFMDGLLVKLFIETGPIWHFCFQTMLQLASFRHYYWSKLILRGLHHSLFEPLADRLFHDKHVVDLFL